MRRRARNEAEDAAEPDGPVRLCVATREVRPVGELIRFVAGPDDAIVPDLRRRLPGRGVWVTATRQAVTQAAAKRAFARALKRPVTAPASLASDVELLLARAARDGFSLANKAGCVVTGFDKVAAAIPRGGVAAVLHATDAAADGVRKLGQALRRRFGPAADEMAFRLFTSDEMSLALGREHVIHALLDEGAAGRACVARLRALERYRAGVAPQGAPSRRGDDDSAPAGAAGGEPAEPDAAGPDAE